ncbi:MAG: CHAT domain-containing protein, partial [Candidatus Krumholzibacteriia bacterium]
PAVVAGLQLRRGRMHAALGNGLAAEEPLREALALAEASHDTAAVCTALRWLAVALTNQDRLAEACGLFRQLRVRAQAAGLTEQEAWGIVGTGYCAERHGDLKTARDDYSRALSAFAALGRIEAELFALSNYGNAASGLGDYPTAYASYRRTAALAEQLGNIFLQGMAANNLGTLDLQLGDPGSAAARFAAAAELFARDGHGREQLNSAANVAVCTAALGHHAEAAAELAAIAATAAAQGYPDLRDAARIRLAGIRNAAGSPETAARDLRAILARPDSLLADHRAEAAVALAGILADRDSVAAGLTVLARHAPAVAGRLSAAARLAFTASEGRLIVRAGRPDEGLDRLTAAADEAQLLGLVGQQLQALPEAAAAAVALGRDGQALALLERARDVWLLERGLPADPQWREVYGAQARLVATELAGLILDGAAGVDETDRMRLAFDSLQVFKARTLRERMLGPGVSADFAVPIGLATLQQDILAADELFLDCYVGPRRSIIFAITRSECRVAVLPGDRELGGRLRRLHQLLGAPGRGEREPGTVGETAIIARAVAGLEQDLCGFCADLVAAAGCLTFCPDGALNLLPMAAIFGGEMPAPGLQLQRVPSATILAGIRSRSGPAPPAPARIVAFGGSTAAGGHRLPGVRRELAVLGRYGAVEVGAASGPAGAPAWQAADVLHFAAHATVSDQAPWRSRIHLDAAADSAADSWDAASIAGLRLPARLAVLASCETAGGRILSGEGVQGLASAFLAAGVPAVLATLWPVDDQATARLVDRFYAGLAGGATAAAALGRAQAEVAAQPRWSDPYFWAGFVLIGDGDVRVPLQRRPTAAAWLLGLAAAGALGFVWWLRRQGRARSGGA